MSRGPSPRFALTTLLALAPACGRAPEEAPRAEVPTFAIPAGCAPETIHCESSAPLGLRDGRGHGRGVSLGDGARAMAIGARGGVRGPRRRRDHPRRGSGVPRMTRRFEA